MLTKDDSAVLVDGNEHSGDRGLGRWISPRVGEEAGEDGDDKDPAQESDQLHDESDHAESRRGFQKWGGLFFKNSFEHDRAQKDWQTDPREREPGIDERVAARVKDGQAFRMGGRRAVGTTARSGQCESWNVDKNRA